MESGKRVESENRVNTVSEKKEADGKPISERLQFRVRLCLKIGDKSGRKEMVNSSTTKGNRLLHSPKNNLPLGEQ